MADHSRLTLARELAEKNRMHFPNESAEYRTARTALLAEEIELRRHIERVAAQRRQLPPGGKVAENYRFESRDRPITLEDLFGDKDTLVAYSWMFGPQRKRPCPMCTSMIESWVLKVPNITQRVSLVVIGRSPIERQLAFARERGWRYLSLISDIEGDYTRDYVSAEDADMPAYNVFTRRDGTIRHFWSSEMAGHTADPGQDPRGAPDPDPLWTLLDLAPEGRGPDWYPTLDDGPR
jgi:predicted dithiol-disulfide oxidoreductase (DUF899 family)